MTMNNPIQTRAGENYLTEAEEKALFATIKGRKGKQAERDFALLKMCRHTALRRGEAIALNVGDVTDNGVTIKNQLVVDERIAKKGATGAVYMNKDLREILAAHLRRKRTWGESLAADAPLFVSKKGGRIGARTFNDLMGNWCREAGINIYTPHALRHTKAHRIIADLINLLPEEQQQKLQFCAEQLRHKAFSSTMIYTKPTKEQMERVGGI
ncbi:MAG: site-specific integrase [Desulfobulbaceae bacterium]|nr:site-specific integrase [Desulfobulbaceae bacterium]